jgi:hypothetical protein
MVFATQSMQRVTRRTTEARADRKKDEKKIKKLN